MVKRLNLKASDLLIILVLFHFVGNVVWIKLNNAPPAWDEASHTKVSLEYLNFFQNLTKGKLNFQLLTQAFSDYYGPLIRILTALLLFVTTSNIKLAQFSGTIFFLLTLVIIYKLGKLIYKNEWIGLMAAFIFSFYQVVYDYSRWLLLDIPLVFFILLTIYFLIKSDFFNHKKYTIITFICSIFVILTKVQGFIYLLIPILFSLIFIFKDKNRSKLINLVTGLKFFFPIIGFYLILSLKNIVSYFKTAILPEPIADPANLLDPITWFHYLKLFIDYEITFGIFIFFIISLFLYLKSPSRLKTFLLINIIFYYLWFTVFPNKDMRYLFPILPFTALVFARGFREIYQKRRFLAWYILSLIIIFNTILYLSLSFGLPLEKGTRKQFELPYIKDIVYLNLTDYPVRIFNPKVWPQEKIIKDLQQEAKGQKLNLVFIPNYDNFNDNNFRMYLSFYDVKNINIIRAEGKIKFNSQKEVQNYIDNFTYFLYTPDEVGVFYQIDKRAFEQIQYEVGKLLSGGKLEILNTYFLPTSQKILLLRRL